MPLQIKESKRTGKFRFRVTGGNGENMVASELFASDSNADRGFSDLLDEMLRIADNRNELIDALERTGLLKKLNESL